MVLGPQRGMKMGGSRVKVTLTGAAREVERVWREPSPLKSMARTR